MDIKFKILEINENDKMGSAKGFQNSIIYGYIEDINIGFIKITLLKQEVFNSFNPTVWHYMKNWVGWTGIELEEMNSDRDAFINSVLRYKGYWDTSLKNMTLEEKEKALKSVESYCIEKMEKSINFFVDKPFVCYVQLEQEFQKKGLAPLFYKEAHALVLTWGLELYSDDCQTESAKKVWNKMVDSGVATSLGKRFKYLG